MYVLAPINTAPQEMASSIWMGTVPSAVEMPLEKLSAPAVVRNTR